MFYPCSCQTVHLDMGLFPKSGQKAGLLNMFGKHSSQDHSFKLCNENLTKEFILGLQQGRANLQTYIVFVSHQAAFWSQIHICDYLMQVFGGNLLSTALVEFYDVDSSSTGSVGTPSAIPMKNFGQHYFSIWCHVSFIIIHHEFVLHTAQKVKLFLILHIDCFSFYSFKHAKHALRWDCTGTIGVETTCGKAQF